MVHDCVHDREVSAGVSRRHYGAPEEAMMYHGDIIVYQEELWCTGEIYGVPRGHYGVPRGHYGVPKGDNLSGREEVIRSCTMERYKTHKNMTIAVNTTVKKKREAPKQ